MRITEIYKREQLGDYLEINNYDGYGIEIGVQSGYFSEQIFSKWKKCKKFYMVDAWEQQNSEIYFDAANFPNDIQNNIYNECKSRFQKFESDKYEMIKKYSVDASKVFEDNYFDFIYIDANHSYESTLEDIISWYPKLKKNGIISGHDYFDEPNIKFGVKSAVDLFFKENNIYRTEHDSPENNNRWSWIVIK